ncbi:MAG: helix-turn-helix domain-containing protein [Oscillospiraceae bacterium]|nr:helix-turn-helix domain-containing protein [Oscillospiraceae bacterium]
MNAPEKIREIIIDILEQKNASTHKMLIDCGYNTSLVNDLKKGQMPSADKIAKIANYLGVSIDYLLGNERKDDGSETSNNAQKVSDDKFINDLRAAFYGNENKRLTIEDKQNILDMIKMMSKFKSSPKQKKSKKDEQGELN